MARLGINALVLWVTILSVPIMAYSQATTGEDQHPEKKILSWELMRQRTLLGHMPPLNSSFYDDHKLLRVAARTSSS